MNPINIIVAVAMPAELDFQEFKKYALNKNRDNPNLKMHYVHTGIGMTADTKLLEAINKIEINNEKVTAVINVGTAGLLNANYKDIKSDFVFGSNLFCNMKGMPSLKYGQNLNSTYSYKNNKNMASANDTLHLENPFKSIPSVNIITTACFDNKTDSKKVEEILSNSKLDSSKENSTIEEMEAFLLAKLCLNKGIAFFPIKRIANSLDSTKQDGEISKEFESDLDKSGNNISFLPVINDAVSFIKENERCFNFIKYDPEQSFIVLFDEIYTDTSPSRLKSQPIEIPQDKSPPKLTPTIFPFSLG